MSFFIFIRNAYNNRLYTGSQTKDDRGYVAFVLPPSVPSAGETIELEVALDSDVLNGSFVFSAANQVFDNQTQADSFVDAVTTVVNNSLTDRAFLWLLDPEQIQVGTVRVMSISPDGDLVRAALNAVIAPSLVLQVRSGTRLSLLS